VVEFDFGNGDILADGDTVDPIAADYGVAITAAGDQVALVADPAAMGFEYQTFGIWASGLDTGTGRAGAGSFGRATPVSSLPASGEATYAGQATGFFVDPEGMSFATFADFEAGFDFGNKTIFASTSGTTAIDTVTGVSSPMASLNFAGGGTVSVGGPFGPPVDGTFTADIAATDLSGSLNGRLFGPNGEEIGGVFNMSGLAGQYIGSVGAAQ
jgi:hypothetical protein